MQNNKTLDLHASTGACFMVHSELFGGAAWEISAAVTEANARTAAKAVEKPTVGDWPRWQVSYNWTAGTTKTATLLPQWEDANGVWRKLGSLELKDTFVKGDIGSQLMDIIAPAGAVNLAMELTDYVDGTLEIEVRGVA